MYFVCEISDRLYRVVATSFDYNREVVLGFVRTYTTKDGRTREVFKKRKVIGHTEVRLIPVSPGPIALGIAYCSASEAWFSHDIGARKALEYALKGMGVDRETRIKVFEAYEHSIDERNEKIIEWELNAKEYKEGDLCKLSVKPLVVQ